MVAYNVGRTIRTPSGVYTGGKDFTADGHAELFPLIPGGNADFVVTIAIDVDKAKVLYITSERTLVITSGASTINIVAGVPYIWDTDMGAFPIAVDTSALHFNLAAGNDSNVEIHLLQDSTPA